MSTNTEQDNGLMHLGCVHSVPETVTLLKSALKEHGLRVFARIDHSGADCRSGTGDAANRGPAVWQSLGRNADDDCRAYPGH